MVPATIGYEIDDILRDRRRPTEKGRAVMERRSGSLIAVHKVQPGEARAGCDPRGVQILYKESTTTGGSPNFVYLDELLRGRGLLVKAGEVISGTPLRHLCVSKPGGTLTRDAILELLGADPEIDLTNVNRPEGNLGA